MRPAGVVMIARVRLPWRVLEDGTVDWDRWAELDADVLRVAEAPRPDAGRVALVALGGGAALARRHGEVWTCDAPLTCDGLGRAITSVEAVRRWDQDQRWERSRRHG